MNLCDISDFQRLKACPYCPPPPTIGKDFNKLKLVITSLLLCVCLHVACRMCKIMCGEIVCDPMCGGGSIPIEVSCKQFVLITLIMNACCKSSSNSNNTEYAVCMCVLWLREAKCTDILCAFYLIIYLSFTYFKVSTIVLLLILLKKPIFITNCNDCYSNFILAL